MHRRIVVAAAFTLVLSVACDQGTPVETPPRGVNHRPSADIGGPYRGLEGSLITFDGSQSRDPDRDSLTFQWTFERGSPPQSGAISTHAFGNQGSYRATLVVSDAHGAADTATASVAIANAPPEITVFNVPVDPVPLDSAARVLLAFSDPGTGDTLTAELDWGDGHSESVRSAVPASHLYGTVGQYLARLTVHDNDGASVTQSAPNPTAVYDPFVNQASEAGYEVTDLGTLGGSGTIPRGLNDVGQVVGCSQTASGTWHAFVWSDGIMRDLGSGDLTSCAWTINNSGTIGGVAGETTDGAAVLVWSSSGQRMDLGTPSCCRESVGFVRVTDGGDIVGGGTDEGHSFDSAIWQDGVRREIPSPLPGYAAARAVNDLQQVVGYAAIASYVGSHIEHPIIWEDGKTRDLGLLADHACPDQPVRSCADGFAVDINNNGAIVGASQDSSGKYQGVLWANGSVEAIGSWRPIAINHAGDVIGNGSVSWYPDGTFSITGPPTPSTTGEAYFWRSGSSTKLPSLDGNKTQVAAINELSTVTGWSFTKEHNPHVFVWAPGQSQLIDLGIGPRGLHQLGAVAMAINARGDIIGRTVGTCFFSGQVACSAWNGPTHAILWRRKN